MLSGRSKTTMPVLTSHACDQTWVAGSTTSIIESLLVLARLVARATESAASTGNGRGASFVERRLRLTAAHRERSGCSPACLPPEGTSWPSSRCTDARTSPGPAAGALPRRAFAVDCTCRGCPLLGGSGPSCSTLPPAPRSRWPLRPPRMRTPHIPGGWEGKQEKLIRRRCCGTLNGDSRTQA